MNKKFSLLLFTLLTSLISYSQVGINTEAPDPATVLDVTSLNKGMLAPRVVLTSVTMDLDGDSYQPAGLLVYNAGGNLPAGYMVWNGTEWRSLSTSTAVSPDAVLNCGRSVLDPEQVIKAGVPILEGTVIKIPYTLGNGGVYKGVTLSSVGNPGVTAKLNSGQLENGSGFLSFFLSGMPVAGQDTPVGVTFDMTPFYTENPSIEQSCTTITIGTEVKANISSAAVIDNLKATSEGGFNIYAAQITTPDGRFSIRAYILSQAAGGLTFGTDSPYGMNLQIRNNTTSDLVIAGQFNWQWGASNGNGVNNLGLQPGKWSGDGEANLSGDVTAPAWASYMQAGATAIGTTSTTNKINPAKFVYWGNPGVYAGNRPERRTYSWTINDGSTTKTAYFLTFSSSAIDPGQNANPTNCPNGICNGTKVFLKIDQVEAQ